MFPFIQYKYILYNLIKLIFHGHLVTYIVFHGITCQVTSFYLILECLKKLFCTNVSNFFDPSVEQFAAFITDLNTKLRF